MARIPMGNGGQQMPGRTPMVNIQQGGQTARAVQDLGAVAFGIANDEIRRQTEVALVAKKAHEAATLQDVENALRVKHDDLSAGILRGEVDKTRADAVWAEESKKLIDQRMQEFGETSRPIVAPRLQSVVGTFGVSLRRTVEKKNRDDISADMVTGLENLSRSYQVDPQRAEASMNVLLDTLGPASNYSAEQLAKLRQGWKEAAQYTKGFEAVSLGRNDPQALAEAKKVIGTLGDLDPQRRVQLMDRVAGYEAHQAQQRELRAARAQRMADARLNEAGAEFQAATSIIQQGKVLRPEVIERVTAATAGTPYQAAFRESLKSMQERTAFGSQPLAVQQQALQQMRAQLNTGGTDAGIEKQYGTLQKMHEAQAKAYTDDPMTAALEYGDVDELAPIAVDDVGSFVQTMGERVKQAKVVQAKVGRPVSPLTQPEAEQVAVVLGSLPVRQRATALAQIATTAGPQVSQALAAQVAAKDRALGLAMAAGSARTTEGRMTSELILAGAQALKDKTAAPDATKDSGWRREIATAIGDAYPSEELRQAAIEAAYFIRAGLDAEGKGSNAQAVRLATGGIVNRNGRRVPLPYGMDADTFDRRLRDLTPQALGAEQVYIDGRPMPAAQFLDGLIASPLQHAGPGRYVVPAGRTLATRDPEGRVPLYIEVR